MIKKGDLVRHISDPYVNNLGLGLVTDVVECKEKKAVARVVWQDFPDNIIYPADLFTFEGLVVVATAVKNNS